MMMMMMKSLETRLCSRIRNQHFGLGVNLGPDLQDILQVGPYLTIMTKLRSTYDGRLINKTSHEERKDLLGIIRLTCKIVRLSEIVFVH